MKAGIRCGVRVTQRGQVDPFLWMLCAASAKAQWLKDSEDSEDLLASAAEGEFSVVVETSAAPVEAKVTFSRLILADGTLANPHKDVVPLKAETE